MSSLERTYLIKEGNEGLLNEDLWQWLIAGYAKDYEITDLSLDVNKTIKIYFGKLWIGRIIHFDREKGGENVEFVTGTRIKQKWNGYSTVLTNRIMNPKISSNWKVKYRIISEEIECFIGYAVKDEIKEYKNHGLGVRDNEEISTGISINTKYDCYYLCDPQYFNKTLKYPNQPKPKENDEFEILYDLESNKMHLSHNGDNAVEIDIVAAHKGKELIPATSFYHKDNEIEILSFCFLPW
eukprot:298734_1